MRELNVTYAADTSNWEDWQRDYRLGLILIVPPPKVSTLIDSLRVEYDPRSAAICQSHISVSDPLDCEMTSSIHSEIRHALASITPFRLNYGTPHASGDRPGVACPVFPQAPIDRLKRALHSTSAFSRKAYKRRHIPSHMTIAEFLPSGDRLTLCDKLQKIVKGGTFLCDRLQFMVPDNSFRFKISGTFYLGDTT